MAKKVWQFAYYYFITPLMLIMAHFAAFFSPKIRRGLYPRYRSIQKLKTWRNKSQLSGKTILFHAASMGEFEHIKPLLKELKQKYNTINIITLFSPSAYEHIKLSEDFDFYLYMPIDTPSNWREIYGLINPSMIIFAKYDVWPAQVWMAKEMAIPLFLINATLKINSSRTRFPLRNILIQVYSDFNNIYAISSEDAEGIRRNFPRCRVEVLGDTKYDQVIVRKKYAMAKDMISESWYAEHWIFVAGSIWSEDEEYLLPSLTYLLGKYSKFKIILVPHVPDDKTVARLIDHFNQWGVILFSNMKKAHVERVLIIDSIGLLAEIYKYARLAYVGGSFKQRIHNVMEPAIYGIPVLFGPKHENSYEAIKLVQKMGGIVVHDSKSMLKEIESFMNNEEKTVIVPLQEI